jgi:hypothetical protein
MRTGIATLAVFLFFLAVLLATSAAHAQVIHACAHKQTGVLRLVADAAACGQNESAVAWNQEGPKGDTGEPGEPGPPGAEGPAGPGGLTVVDGEGIFVGRFDSGNLIVGSGERVGRLRVTPTAISGSTSLRYETDDCSSQAFRKFSVPELIPHAEFDPSDNNGVYLPRPYAALMTIMQRASRDPDGMCRIGCCGPEPVDRVVPYDRVFELDVSPPFSVQ